MRTGVQGKRTGLVLAVMAVLCGCSGGGEAKNEAAANAVAVSQGDAGPQYLKKLPLRVYPAKGGGDVRLSVEVAITPEEQEKGLMHRDALARGEGMLFPSLPPRNVSFWMKETPLALDMIFIQADGRIVKIAANAKPNDPTPIFADVPVVAVLEVRGGDARALGIAEGDRVAWGECTQQPGLAVTKTENFCPAS